MADSRSSFLGSISPWSISRSGTPTAKAQPQEAQSSDTLKPGASVDHSISVRPSPSLRHYPKDCPTLKARWYYAVDVAKRKPFAPETSSEDDIPMAAAPAPKKFVPFSTKDSQAIEDAFQALDLRKDGKAENTQAGTRVPVNEDYLFNVHLEKRELEPAYWLGPVYEIRRGSWFYQEATLRACDENLANQLEEGYLKVAPWRRASLVPPRSSSQPRSRPTSAILEGVAAASKLSVPVSPKRDESAPPGTAADVPNPNSHRLFGTHMNTTVTYQDASVAFLTTDDFISRMSSSVYGRFGAVGGTKVVRGYTEGTKAPEPSSSREPRPRSANASVASDKGSETPTSDLPSVPSRPSALERQLSSLAGIAGDVRSAATDDEEAAREEEEQEMEAARDLDGEDQGRKIDHLVLVTHGIGQRLGLRLDSINFVHDVNTFRKTMKAVYSSAPDLQALSDNPKNCRIQVLPICWRHLLDFPRQSVRQNRKEFDLGDTDPEMDDEYPSLHDITVEGIPYVRALTSDLVLDVLLYQSAYREHIASIVQKETNRVLQLFKERTGFDGTVSLVGHSLGSAILFDILCRQGGVQTSRRRVSSRSSRDAVAPQQDLKLNFDCDSFFALGSPIALFQMLKGRTIAGRTSIKHESIPMTPFDPDSTSDPFFQSTAKGGPPSSNLIPIGTSSPKCAQFYNIFHPTDPIAYRIEPLISPAMASLKPQELPFTKTGLFAAPGIANISARVGQSVMSSWYSLTSGVANSLINRSLGISGEEQALQQDKVRPSALAVPHGQTHVPSSGTPVADSKKQQALAEATKSSSNATQTLIDTEMDTLFAGFQKRRSSHGSGTSNVPSAEETAAEQERLRRFKREEAKVRALNSNGRVDYSIQEGMFDVSLLASIASHLSYWADEDVNHFMIGQLLKKGKEKKAVDGGGA